MVGEHLTSGDSDIEIEAEKQEIHNLLNDIEKYFIKDSGDGNAISLTSPVRFRYRGQHFGIYAYSRAGDDEAEKSRSVVMMVYNGSNPMPYSPDINLNLVTESNQKFYDSNIVEINNLPELQALRDVLRFTKTELPSTSYDEEPVEDVPKSVCEFAEKLREMKEFVLKRT